MEPTSRNSAAVDNPIDKSVRTAESRANLRGILLMILVTAGFAGTDACAKWLNLREPAMQTVSVRYIGAFLLTLCFLNPRLHPGIARTRHPWLQVMRGLSLFAVSGFTFSALRLLPMTTVTSITFAAPLAVALLAGPILGERIGPRRVVAVVVGFIGVLVITRPGTSGFQPVMGLALAGAAFNAVYVLLTRFLSRSDSPQTIHFYTGLVTCLTAIPFCLFAWEKPASLQTWLVMGVISVLGAVSHWLMILAHRQAPASVLSPFFYTQLLFATVVGAIVFGNTPDLTTVVGGGIVIGSGLYLLYRERLRHRVPSVDVAA